MEVEEHVLFFHFGEYGVEGFVGDYAGGGVLWGSDGVGRGGRGAGAYGGDARGVGLYACDAGFLCFADYFGCDGLVEV